MKSNVNTLKAQINPSIVNALAPTSLRFEKDSFTLSDSDMTGYCITRYPSKANYGWLTPVCNMSNTITSLTFTPEPNVDAMLKSISNNVATYQPVAERRVSADAVEIARAEKIVRDGTKIIEQIANYNEAVGYCSLNTLVVGNDKNDVHKKSKVVKNKYTGYKFVATLLPFIQKEIMRAVSPCCYPPVQISDITNQIMPISTILGGFPFSFSGYNDGEGSYFGKDSSGGLIIVDGWKRGKDRLNSNMVFMGVPGVGKSTALKHLIQNEWEQGTKIVLIDPHGEYKDLCKNLGGEWIDVVGGTGGRINPFHIYVRDKSEDEEKKQMSQLAMHINNLEVFFKLYLDLNPFLTAVLKECIEITYFQKGITWDTDVSRLTAKQFPIMSDLYEVALKKAEENEKTLKRSEANYYKELSILIRNIAKGSDSFIWNGYSTVNTSNDFIVFDTSAVNGNSDNIRTTLYHNVLNYCENYLYRNKHERAILVCDEAHNVIDKRLPATVARLANIEKSCRKFETAIWICSQQLVDFLDSAIHKEGSTLLNMPNIKVLLPVGRGTDLKALKDLYNLNDAEEEILVRLERSKGILMIGSRRLFIEFDIPPHHMAMMGTAGGR